MARSDAKEPAVGTVMVDTARNLIGEYRGTAGGRAHLRPIGGGREWDVAPEFLREATPGDRSNPHLSGVGYAYSNGAVG